MKERQCAEQLWDVGPDCGRPTIGMCAPPILCRYDDGGAGRWLSHGEGSEMRWASSGTSHSLIKLTITDRLILRQVQSCSLPQIGRRSVGEVRLDRAVYRDTATGFDLIRDLMLAVHARGTRI